MGIAQVLRALRSRLAIILAMVVVTVGAALVVTLFQSRIYIATAAVVADVKYADPIAGAILPALTQPGYMATQLDIIQSQRVAETVVRNLRLDQRDGFKKAWQEATDGVGSLSTWIGSNLRVDARPARDSNVIALSVKSADPKLAAELANGFAQAYIDTSLDLRVEPARRFSTYFEEQAQMARDRLERTQAALSSYQRDNGLIVANDERFDIENNRLNELSSQLSAVQSQRMDAQSRQTQAANNGGTSQEVLQSSLVQSLKADVAKQDARIQEMSGNLGPNNPKLQQAQAEADAMRRKLNAEVGQITSGITASNRVVAQRESEVKASLAEQKERVLKLKQDRDAVAVLQRDVDAAQKAFDAVNARVTQSNLESQTNQTNITILNPALEPTRASSPRVVLNLAIALFVGLILGTGMALLLEQIDRRVRSADDLRTALGLPLLGTLPAPARARSLGGRPLRLGHSRPALN